MKALSPTPSEMTLAESEPSVPHAHVDTQVEDSTLEAGYQVTTAISLGKIDVTAAMPPILPSRNTTASGFGNGVGIGIVHPLSGKRKGRVEEEEIEIEKESEQPAKHSATKASGDQVEPLPLAKKRRLDSFIESQDDKTDAVVQGIAEPTTEVLQEVAGATSVLEGSPAQIAALNGPPAAAATLTPPNSDATELNGGVPRPAKNARRDDAPASSSATDATPKVPALNTDTEEEAGTEAPAAATASLASDKIYSLAQDPPAKRVHPDDDAPTEECPASATNSNVAEPPDVAASRPAKKARLEGDAFVHDATSPVANTTTDPNTDTQQPPTTEKPSPLLTIPLELLAEILILTGSPEHVLSTARTCKVLCHTLLSPNAQFIWRETRKGPGCTFEDEVYTQAVLDMLQVGNFMIVNGVIVNVAAGVIAGGAAGMPVREKKNFTLPDPPKNFFGEAAYAAFLFDSGKCECCGNETSLMYASFALRARFCKDPRCKRPTANLARVKLVNGEIEGKLAQILPTNEAQDCLQNGSGGAVWPHVRQKYCRPDKLQVALTEYEAMSNDDSYKNKFELFKERNAEWMAFCVKLYEWRKLRQDKYYSNRKDNESAGKKFASQYGWEHDDLLNTAYGGYQRHKSKLIEMVDEVDVKVMRDLIESQLLALVEKRERRNSEIALMKNREDVEGVYKRMRSGKVHPYLPSLATFRQLPVISMLQSAGQSSPNHSVAATLQNDKVMKELLTSQLKKWTEKAKQDLGVTLGFPKNWKSASKNVLHPVERVTARFLCVKCERVDSKYRVDGCLDFAGACLHECGTGNQKKGRVKKNKAVWDAKNFVKDEKAINVLKKCIEALGFAEDRDGGNYLLQIGLAVVCMSCEPCMVLDSRSLIGHSHRHDDMQVSFATMENITSCLGGFPYHYGLAEKLLGVGSLSIAGKKEIDRKNFGCRHCLREKQVKAAAAAASSTSPTEDAGGDAGTNNAQGPTAQTSSSGKGTSAAPEHIELSAVVYGMHDLAMEGPLERPPPLFNFNGMRSHLKSKHQIEDIRDEDILCYRNPDIIL